MMRAEAACSRSLVIICAMRRANGAEPEVAPSPPVSARLRWRGGAPFRATPQAACKSARLRLPPQRRTVLAALRPGGFELRDERLQGACSATEHIRAAAAEHLADELAGTPGAPDDLLDRHTLLGQGQNGSVLPLPALPSVILLAFRTGQLLRINPARAKHG